MASSGKRSGRTSGKKATAAGARNPRAEAPAPKTDAPKTARKKVASRKKPGAARETPAATSAPAVPRPQAFRDRLGSLENLLDEALLESGGPEDLRADEGPLVRAAEGALDVYARLGRILEETSVAEALAGLGSRLRGDPEDFGADRDFERALMPLLRFLYRSWWRVETVGVEHVPSAGPVVLVANNAGTLFAYDGAMLRMALRDEHPARREVRPLLDAVVCDQPLLGEIITRCGGVRASEDNARALLTRGAVVACFPEGNEALGKPFRRRYELGAFEDGEFVRIALETGAPIVPVAIVGAEETHPVLGRVDWVARRLGVPYLPLTPTFPWFGIGGLLPLPSRWRIEFGTPLEELAGFDLGAGDDPRRIRNLTARVRRRVQSLVDHALARRGRAFF